MWPDRPQKMAGSMCPQKAHTGRAKIGHKTPNLAKFDVGGRVCRLGARTLKIFLVRKGTHLPYMCAKYHWLTSCGLGDTALQK